MSLEFGKYFLGSNVPSQAQRAAFIRDCLDDFYFKSGYLSVVSVEMPAATTCYALVTYKAAGQQFKTVVAGSVTARKKSEGYWLKAELFFATGSMPSMLTYPTQALLDALEKHPAAPSVDDNWLNLSARHARKAALMPLLKKGAVFVSNGKQGVSIFGRLATYAVVLNKDTALFLDPLSGSTSEGSADDLLDAYKLVPQDQIPVFAELGNYSETAELVFEVVGGVAKFKGRLARGAKAKALSRKVRQQESLIEKARDAFAPVNLFASGGWLA